MSERKHAYESMSREEMLDTVTGYTDDEATEKMADRTTAVDEFMELARDATVPDTEVEEMETITLGEPEPAPMPEPPAPPASSQLGPGW